MSANSGRNRIGRQAFFSNCFHSSVDCEIHKQTFIHPALEIYGIQVESQYASVPEML